MDAPSTLLYLTLPSASASGAVSVEFPAKICYNASVPRGKQKHSLSERMSAYADTGDQLPMPVLHRAAALFRRVRETGMRLLRQLV